jgi:ethanolamine utilization microcompartment shell protein EutL
MDNTTSNDVTGDRLATKAASEAFRSNYGNVFGKKKAVAQPDPVTEALENPQQITHVALKDGNKIYSLPAPNRHHNVIGMIGGTHGQEVQGFLDANGVFLNRKQAFVVAQMTGQLNRQPFGYQGPELFSEDLW